MRDAFLPSDFTRTIAEAVRQISGMTHFYSQSEGDCIGALMYSANTLGLSPSKAQAIEMVPKLREALKAVSECF